MNVYRHTWLRSDFRQRYQSGDKTTSLRLRTLKWLGKWFLLGMLLGLVVPLAACMHQPIKPCEMPPVPTAPALTEPLPSVPYSLTVGERIKSWAKKLTDTPVMSKP